MYSPDTEPTTANAGRRYLRVIVMAVAVCDSCGSASQRRVCLALAGVGRLSLADDACEGRSRLTVGVLKLLLAVLLDVVIRQCRLCFEQWMLGE